MDFFIKKIFEGIADEFTHSQFQKFSRGEFPYRAMVRVKKSKNKYTIATTAEYAKELILTLAGQLGENKTLVTGALISALPLEGFEYKEKKSAIGINKYLLETEMSGNEIINLCNKVPKAFFGLSFKFDDTELKIQPKSPKSSKGSTPKKKEGEKIKIDFCKIKTTNSEVANKLLFDITTKDFKQIEIIHNYIIDEIIVTDELKQEAGSDFAKLREMAKRKGKLIRNINIDGNETKTEKEFTA